MKKEDILEILQELDDETLRAVWNEYCDEDNMFDDHIYENDEFNEIFQNRSPEDIAQVICNGDFSINDEYFTFDGYGNLESSSNVNNLIYIEDLANFILRNDETFNIDELGELLEEEDYLEEDDG